jgi:uncharacterized protein (TIGR02444 family)
MSAVENAPAGKSPFWRFSVKFYAEPGVAQACIDLQDQAGVDVNLLFFLLWNAAQGRELSHPEVAEIDRDFGAWRDLAVVPLRELRRALKSPPSAVTPDAAEGFRTRIKAVELEAERLQQEAMYSLARSAASPGPAGSAGKSHPTSKRPTAAWPPIRLICGRFRPSRSTSCSTPLQSSNPPSRDNGRRP